MLKLYQEEQMSWEVYNVQGCQKYSESAKKEKSTEGQNVLKGPQCPGIEKFDMTQEEKVKLSWFANFSINCNIL